VSDASVRRDVVVKVLKASGVDVSIDGDKYTLAKEGVAIQTIVLPPHVGRRMLFRFQYKYQIPIHLFFNPEMMSSGKDAVQ